jgi:D-alanyl-lipoteichoic acid acyltransferase DltB (MBOAT superfamily)
VVAVLESFSGLMRFTSVAYLMFLALCVIVYFALPGVRTRAAFLLVVSAAFYILLSPRTFVVLLAVTAGSYLVGLVLGHPALAEDGPYAALRSWLLGSGIVVIVGVLVGYKYLGFFQEAASGLLSFSNLGATQSAAIKLLLPIGISFWTFQSIAYLVDIYRGKTEPVRNPLMYSLAVMFFPIVTAGPITRVQALTEQLEKKHRFSYEGMQSGLLLIGLGFFKKLMIADRLAVFVNTVFDHPRNYTPESNGMILLVAAVFFAIQLYTDFSGYVDIVRGSARLFGVELPLNFDAPYFSRSVREFWRRWHMTLMDWFREYIYIPLGGNRRGKVRRYFNLFVVFVISGLWHGAGFTYLVWGVLNGVYVVGGELLAPLNNRIVRLLRVDRDTLAHRAFQTVFTFVLVTIAWVFFRANTLSDALYIVPRMFSPTVWNLRDGSLLQQGLTYSELLIALVSVAALGVVEWASLNHTDLLASFNRQHVSFRWATYYTLILVVVLFGHYGGTYNPADFVYFKF